ncbi:MAG TPA: peptidoglycan bridge formation glycyltransferase FemA/FemB family protein [Bacillota bacterium]
MHDRYDEYVAHAQKGHILQSYEWGEIKAKTGWTPIRLLVEDRSGPRGAVSILRRDLPYVGRTIFYSPRGPVLDYRDTEAFDCLITQVRRLAPENRAIMWKIDPDVEAHRQDVRDHLKSRGFGLNDRGADFEGVQPRFVFRLALEKSLDDLFADFASKTRYNIRLAGRKGVAVRVAVRADLPEFYRILLETARRDRFLVRSFDYFTDLWDHLVERGLARLFVAELEGRMIAGTLAFIFGDKAWYIYGASANDAREVMPNYALQWEMIRWAKESGCVMYDFRGVSGDLDPNNPLYGLYRFKKGFSGQFTEFIGEYDLVFSPLVYWMWNWGEPLYRRTRSKIAGLRRRATGGNKE